MAMHGVDAEENRDLEPGEAAMPLQPVVEIGPGLQAVALLGIGPAAAKNRPDEVALYVRDVFDELLIGLRHLADLFLQRHLCQKRLDLRVESGQWLCRRIG